MTFLIPDRKAVAQLKYQLRRFEKQCAQLPESTRLRIQQEMQGLRSLLGEREPGRCADHGEQCNYEVPPYGTKLRCVTCGSGAPADTPEQDSDYVGWGCRGLGLDHRWQKSEFSDKVFCTKCGEQKPEEA